MSSHSHRPSWPPSPPHSTEVESRLTRSEIKLDAHHERITNLERIILIVLYALGGLSAKLSGEIADLLIKALAR